MRWHLPLNLIRRLGKHLRRWGQWLLDVAYPRDCLFCRQPSGDDGFICIDCLQRLIHPRNPSCTICGAESLLPEGNDFICSDCLRQRPNFERVFVFARFDGAIRDLIHLFKYKQGTWLLDDLTRFMAATYIEQIAPLDLHIDALIPIPMQLRKRYLRGYNQAALLARALAKQLSLPCVEHVLKRVHTGNTSQARLHRSERLKNAIAAYRITHPHTIQGKTLLLIDDVITTGATCNACAHLLRNAGAKKVYVLVLARPVTL